MKKIIVCGKENLDGKLIPAPLDEKNITTDWIEDFLFDFNVARNPEYEEELIGYFQSIAQTFVAHVEYSRVSNYVRYTFFQNNWLSADDILAFENNVRLYFHESDLTIEMVSIGKNDGTFDACITLFFYFRDETEKA